MGRAGLPGAFCFVSDLENSSSLVPGASESVCSDNSVIGPRKREPGR